MFEDFGVSVDDEPLRLIPSSQMGRVEYHEAILDVARETEAMWYLHIAMDPTRMPEMSKRQPVILWGTPDDHLVLVRNHLSFYEALAHDTSVYARVCELTPKQALAEATQEAIVLYLQVLARQGEGLPLPPTTKPTTKNRKKPGDLKRLPHTGKNPHRSKLTSQAKDLLRYIFGDSDLLAEVFKDTKLLSNLKVLGKVLQVPHGTISNWCERLRLRERPTRGRIPKPLFDRRRHEQTTLKIKKIV
jgi:hypothetical protein